MTQNLQIVIEVLLEAGYRFRFGDYTRKPNGKTDGETVFIFSLNKLQPAKDFDGGSSSRFKIVSGGAFLPSPRHAVVCKIEMVNGHLTFFANHYPLYSAATRNMARLFKDSSVSREGIEANLECWEDLTSSYGAGFIGQ